MNTPNTSRRSWGFALLLRLYPATYRAHFSDELWQCFHQDRVLPQFQGLMGAARFWSRLIPDHVGAAIRERRAQTVSRSAHVAPSFTWSTTMIDLRHALRGLLRDPTYTVIAVLTLTLGIGATTTVFTVVQSVVLAPLPYPEPDRLVRIYERERNNPGAVMVAYGNYEDLRENAAFDDVAIWAYSSHILTGVDQATQIRSRQTSGNFASTMQVSPIMGRWFTEAEAIEDAAVAVLSHSLWQAVFDTTANVLGATVLLDGTPHTVLGVMPPQFDFPSRADAWIPLTPVTNPNGSRRWHRHAVVGRLAPNISNDDARATLLPLAQQLESRYPETNTDNYFEAVPLLDSMVGPVRPALRMLFAAVVALMLIACVNIASLALARSTSRAGDLALRRALGASQTRLASLIVVEALLVSFTGAILGVVLAAASIDVVLNLASGSIPRAEHVGMNGTVLLFGFGAALTSGLLVAIAPVLFGSRKDRVVHSGFLSAGRQTGSKRALRGRRALVAAELAIAFVLAVSAGLLMRSFASLTSVDSGANAESVLTFDIRLASAKYDQAQAARFLEQLTEQIEGVPGVTRAGVTLTPPVYEFGWQNSLTIRGRPVPESERTGISYVVASSGYLDAIGINVLQGRMYRPDEGGNDLPVAVINQAAAERYWPEQSPIGQHILGSDEMERPWAEVIGVVENVRQSLREPARPEVYVPLTQDRVLSFVVLARIAGDPIAAMPPLRTVIEAADPDIPIANIQTLNERIGQSVAQPRFTAALTSAFAALAVILACVGVHGLLAYSVAQRKREFGIRIAVGADRRQVLATVLKEAGVLAVTGIGIGIVGALTISRLIQAMLFEVGANDPLTLIAVALTLGAVTFLAGWAPARTATAVDPVGAIREE